MSGLLLNTGEWRETAALNREEGEAGEVKVGRIYECEGWYRLGKGGGLGAIKGIGKRRKGRRRKRDCIHYLRTMDFIYVDDSVWVGWGLHLGRGMLRM